MAERREGGEGFDAEGVYSDKNDVCPFPSPILTISSISTLLHTRTRFIDLPFVVVSGLT